MCMIPPLKKGSCSMNWLFDENKPLMRALSVIADLMILNILTILCSLPIVTAGAAITSMFCVAIRIIRNEDGGMLRDFFRSFRTNFKKATVLWLILLAAALLIYVDYIAAQLYIPVMCAGIAAIAVIVLVVAIYAFALLARYDNTLGGTLKNAMALAVAYFPKTIGMTVFTIAFWMLAVYFIQYGAPILVMFGLSLPCYVAVLLMNGMFNKLENKQV